MASRPVPVPAGVEAATAARDWQRQALAVAVVDGAGVPGEAVVVPMGATVLRRLVFAAEGAAGRRRPGGRATSR